MFKGSLVLLTATALAQPIPQFEAASIKIGHFDERMMRVGSHGGPGTEDPTFYTCENCDIAWLIGTAYGIASRQLDADHLESTPFNVSARIPPETTNEQFRQMMQNLLRERFHLAIHWEKRESKAYDLLVAKGGPKLKESVPLTSGDDAGSDIMKTDERGFPILPASRSGTAGSRGHMAMRGVDESTSQLARQLSAQLHAPVDDASGLTGKYDFLLNWVPDSAAMSADSGPTLIEAVQQQLGLQLRSKKGTTEMLVVDHVQKTPTEN
jgi:uncharacterized protein (TIGR03435 family)